MAGLKRASRPVHSTYRVTAETTAQAMRIAEEFRQLGWTCSTRGRRLVLTTYVEAYLPARAPLQIWQMDKSSHEEASQKWLVPELRGRRPGSGGPGELTTEPSLGLEGEERDAGDQEIKDDHGKG